MLPSLGIRLPFKPLQLCTIRTVQNYLTNNTYTRWNLTRAYNIYSEKSSPLLDLVPYVVVVSGAGLKFEWGQKVTTV